MVSASRRGSATAADLAAMDEGSRFHEVIGGVIVPKAQPTFEHGDAQRRTSAFVDPWARRPGGNEPGGWWIATEVEVQLETHEVYRPDIVGWRRDRVPERPSGAPVGIRPDWIAEILSPSNVSNDTVKKMRGYFRAEVPHYWLLDPTAETLTVCRWTQEGYLTVLLADGPERVRAEPFADIEVLVASLFRDIDGHE